MGNLVNGISVLIRCYKRRYWRTLPSAHTQEGFHGDPERLLPTTARKRALTRTLNAGTWISGENKFLLFSPQSFQYFIAESLKTNTCLYSCTVYVTFSRSYNQKLEIMDFSIVILENQVHSAKSILEQRNLLLAKNKQKQKNKQTTPPKTFSIFTRRLYWIMCLLSFLGVPPHPIILPAGQDIIGLKICFCNPYSTPLFTLSFHLRYFCNVLVFRTYRINTF